MTLNSKFGYLETFWLNYDNFSVLFLGSWTTADDFKRKSIVEAPKVMRKTLNPFYGLLHNVCKYLSQTTLGHIWAFEGNYCKHWIIFQEPGLNSKERSNIIEPRIIEIKLNNRIWNEREGKGPGRRISIMHLRRKAKCGRKWLYQSKQPWKGQNRTESRTPSTPNPRKGSKIEHKTHVLVIYSRLFFVGNRYEGMWACHELYGVLFLFSTYNMGLPPPPSTISGEIAELKTVTILFSVIARLNQANLTWKSVIRMPKRRA